MIKIIKEGKKIKTTYKFICPRCGCEFHAETEDVSVWSTHTNEVGVFHKYRCTCPNCKQICIGVEGIIE